MLAFISFEAVGNYIGWIGILIAAVLIIGTVVAEVGKSRRIRKELEYFRQILTNKQNSKFSELKTYKNNGKQINLKTPNNKHKACKLKKLRWSPSSIVVCLLIVIAVVYVLVPDVETIQSFVSNVTKLVLSFNYLLAKLFGLITIIALVLKVTSWVAQANSAATKKLTIDNLDMRHQTANPLPPSSREENEYSRLESDYVEPSPIIESFWQILALMILIPIALALLWLFIHEGLPHEVLGVVGFLFFLLIFLGVISAVVMVFVGKDLGPIYNDDSSYSSSSGGDGMIHCGIDHNGN